MVEIKTQYPYIDEDGNERQDLIKHFAEDENGNAYYIRQKETNRTYEVAVDVYPSKYAYEPTNKIVDKYQF